MAIGRIKDISNSLRLRQPSVASAESALEPLLVPSLVDAVVSEKRMQFSDHLALELEQQISKTSYGFFVRAEMASLKRVLSNLLNNAAEAVKFDGRVSVAVMGDADRACIVIRDNGPGIPAHLLARLGEKGMTYNKPGGSGLGIYHAMETVRAWDGELTFATPASGGTEVTLTLPVTDAPPWFAEKITLNARQTVVILDDDRAVHAAWRERLSRVDVELVHVSSQKQLDTWLAGAGDKEVTFFLDYELAGESENGLDIMLRLGIQDRAFLVTSHFETPAVLQKCTKHGVRMVPKSMVDIVTLEGDATRIAA